MSYELVFDRRALREWRKLDAPIRDQFKRKLMRVLERPRIPANRLHGLPDCYKIKLRSVGYRLIYQVRDAEVLVFVIAIGMRDKKHGLWQSRAPASPRQKRALTRPTSPANTPDINHP